MPTENDTPAESQASSGSRAVTALSRLSRRPDYVQGRVLMWDLVNHWRAAATVDAHFAVTCWNGEHEMGRMLREGIPIEEVALLYPQLPAEEILRHLVYDYPARTILSEVLPLECIGGVWRHILREHYAVRALEVWEDDDPLGRTLQRGVSAQEVVSAWEEVFEEESFSLGFDLWEEESLLRQTLRDHVGPATFLAYWRQIAAQDSAMAARLLSEAPKRIQACAKPGNLLPLLESEHKWVREKALTLLGTLAGHSRP